MFNAEIFALKKRTDNAETATTLMFPATLRVSADVRPISTNSEKFRLIARTPPARTLHHVVQNRDESLKKWDSIMLSISSGIAAGRIDTTLDGAAM